MVRGYRYGSKLVDRPDEVDAILDALPTRADRWWTSTAGWEGLVGEPAELAFDHVPFDHPLYVLFSSGTTGLPKAIVHGHGGILLEHLKSLALHHDLGPGDRFFWFSTTGWMMWNLLVSGPLRRGHDRAVRRRSGLARPGRAVAPGGRDRRSPSSASAPRSCWPAGRAGLDLASYGDLSGIRSVGSTGAPLPAEGFDWVHEQLPHVWLTSVSGGTDVCTAFVGGSPLRAGGRRARSAAATWAPPSRRSTTTGRPVVGEQGELVVTAPMPSMPTRLWGDGDGSRLRDAYFERFPGVWCHGDWITITERGSCMITGRSDATLNRGGVRLGTSEFYAVVEAIPEVADSLVVHLEDPEGGAGRLVLFVAAGRRRGARRRARRTDRGRPPVDAVARGTCPTTSTPCRPSRGRIRARSSRCR